MAVQVPPGHGLFLPPCGWRGLSLVPLVLSPSPPPSAPFEHRRGRSPGAAGFGTWGEAAGAARCSHQLCSLLPKARTRCAQNQRGGGGEESPKPGELRGGEGNQGGHSPSSKRRTLCSVTLSFSGGINLVVLWGRNTTSCPGSGISQSWISPGWEFTLTFLTLLFAAACPQGCSFAALLPAESSWQNLFPFHTRLVQEARPRRQWLGFVRAGKVLIAQCCQALPARAPAVRTAASPASCAG